MNGKSIKAGLLCISLMILGGSMSACAEGGTSWQEEVLLHDGQKIVVKRSVERRGRSEPGQRPPIGDQSVSFTIPGTDQHVMWADEFSEDVGGGNFNLMLLDISQDAAYLLATPAGCLSYNKWGRPNPPYVIFKHLNSEWKRISLQELPAAIKQPNLLQSSPDVVARKNAVNGLVHVAVVQHERGEYRQPEYKTILREPLSKERINEMCEELVYYKGGWVGTGDSIGRRMMDRMSK
jgi:hypothetical protein